jgi:hypothetical protein
MGGLSVAEIPQSGFAAPGSATRLRRIALLLSLPALIPLGNALVLPFLQGMVPTGFIQYDMPYYLANGRQFFNQGIHLTYSNPYAGYNAPAIYFQPQIFLLGLMQQVGLDPGITFNCFAVLALFFAAIAAALFYQEAIGSETTAKRLGFVFFFWGGGMLTLAGLAGVLFAGHPLSSVWKHDPGNGWWMLNFGRNLVNPMEAYYHGVFLLSLLFLIQRRLTFSLLFAAILSLSHPFTGLTLCLILIAWSAIELALRSGAVTLRFMLTAILILVLHLSYYLIWLNRFSEHRAVQAQWQLKWLYPPVTFIPALIVVGTFAIWRLSSTSLRCFRDSRIRLFAVWFLVVFALTQHNLVVRPVQPIHFAHGYDWMALFFLGAAPLIALVDRMLKINVSWKRYGVIALLSGVFLLDNSAWLVANGIHNYEAISISAAQRDTLLWFGSHLKPGDMVISQDQFLSYLVSTYSPAKSWLGHWWVTPDYDRRRREVDGFFREGHVLDEWKRPGVFYEAPAWWSPAPGSALRRRYENSDLSVWSS